MGQVNGRGRFSTNHSSETPQPIFMKLKIYTSLHIVPDKEVPFCGYKDEICNLTLSPKKRKYWDFKLAANGKLYSS